MTTSQALAAYELQAPEWRPPLLLTRFGQEAAYPELFPGTTALYPHANNNLPAAVLPGGPHPGTASTSATPAQEDDLSESVVKAGFVNRPVIQGETASIYPFIHEKLAKGPTVHIVSSLVAAVLERQHVDPRKEASGSTIPGPGKPIIIPNPGPWTFKQPSRVVYNATRLEAWYSELANPAIPLSKLAKNIPNTPSSASSASTSAGVGTYGSITANNKPSDKPMDKNLDMLLNRNVPLDRAIWFLRSIGASEIQQMSKLTLKLSTSTSAQTSASNPAATYISDFTQSLFDLCKRQLADLIMPLNHHANLAAGLGGRPGMSLKGKARNILSEKAPREKWMARWQWCVGLVTRSMEESLVDRNRWATAILAALKECHVVHIEWWSALLESTALSEMLETPCMAKQVVITLVQRDLALESGDTDVPLGDADLSHSTRQALQDLLRRIWTERSDAFFQPSLWLRNRHLSHRLRQILVASPHDGEIWDRLTQRVDAVLGNARGGYDQLHSLLTSLGGKGQTSQQQKKPLHNRRKQMRSLLTILDDFSVLGKVVDVYDAFFGMENGKDQDVSPPGQSTSNAIDGTFSLTAQDRLQLLLDWSISPLRFGQHRKHLACSILKVYIQSNRSAKDEDPGRKSAPSKLDEDRSSVWYTTFFEWLDKVGSRRESTVDNAVRTELLQLCQILADGNLLDVGRLLQVSIARGLRVVDAKREHIYIELLRSLSSRTGGPSLQAQVQRFLDSEYEKRGRDHTVRDQPIKQTLGKIFGIPNTPIAPVSLLGLTPESPTAHITTEDQTALLETVAKDMDESGTPKLLSEWLLHTFLAKAQMSSADLCAAIWLFDHFHYKECLCRLLVGYLSAPGVEEDVLRKVVLPAIESRLLLWTSMQALEDIGRGLYDSYQTLRATGKSAQLLLRPIATFGQADLLPSNTWLEFAVDMALRTHDASSLSAAEQARPQDVSSIAHESQAYEACGQALSTLPAPALYIHQVILHLAITFNDVAAAVRLYGHYDSLVAEGLEQAMLDHLHSFVQEYRHPVRKADPDDGNLEGLLSLLQALIASSHLEATVAISAIVLPLLSTLVGAGLASDVSQRTATLLVTLVQNLYLDSSVFDACASVLKSHHRLELVRDGFMPHTFPLLQTLTELQSSATGIDDLTSQICEVRDGLLHAFELHDAAVLGMPEMTERCLGEHVSAGVNRQASLRLFEDLLSCIRANEWSSPTHDGAERTRGRSDDKYQETAIALDEDIFLGNVRQYELRAQLARMQYSGGNLLDGPSMQQFLDSLISAPYEADVNIDDLKDLPTNVLGQLLEYALELACEEVRTLVEKAALSSSPDRLRALNRVICRLAQSVPTLDTAQFAALLHSGDFLSQALSCLEERAACASAVLETIVLATRLADFWEAEQDSLIRLIQHVISLQASVASAPAASCFLLDIALFLSDLTNARGRQQLYQICFAADSVYNNELRSALQPYPSQDWTATMKDGSLSLGPARNWELADVAEPPFDTFRDGLLANASSVDLHRLQAQSREVNTTPWQASRTDTLKFGEQATFDSEIPTLRESIWERDFRRSTCQQLEATPATNSSDAVVAPAARKESVKSDKGAADIPKSNNKSAADTAAAATAPAKRPPAKKRKSVPDIQADEEPKRKKAATKAKKK